MYLKRIVMENFKSFGKRIELPLLPGYTAITGPNGSGKSNISDAILFVLGPKSSRAIRAGKLPDLIFNGGPSKRAASECKVSLLFDNSDNVLPTGEKEVELTRHIRLTPGHASDYSSNFFINGRRSQLADFDDLLSHARLSADGYNFIQQGDINRIIQMGAVERRRILDDIAGITKFDADIAKADGERKTVEENLGKIQIILDEIGAQLKQLEHDRGDALKYREFKERLDLANAQIVFKNREQLDHQISGLRKQIEKGDADVAKMAESRSRLAEDLLKAQDETKRLEAEIQSRSTDESKAVRAKLDQLNVDEARAQDAVNSSMERAKFDRDEISKIKKEETKLKKALAEAQAAHDETEAQHKKLTSELEGHQKRYKELENHAAGSDAEVKELQKSLIALTKDIDEKGDKLRALIVEKDRLAAQKDRLLQQAAQLEEEHKTAEFQFKDMDWRMKEARKDSKATDGEIKKLTDDFHDAKKRELELTKESTELDAAVKRLSREYAQFKAESDAQDSVRKGYTRAVNIILEARDKGELKGVHGTIAELAKVDGKYETALYTAAGPRMQAIVVEDDETAAKAIDLLKRGRAGRAAFLPLNKMLDGRPRGKALMAVKEAQGFAIDLIKFEEKYRSAFWYVFGDTIVVDNLTSARRLMGGVRLVTIDGALIEASGAIIGGEKEEQMVRLGGSDSKRLEDVARQLRDATAHLEKVNLELVTARTALSEAELRLRERNVSTGGKGVEIGVMEKELARAKEAMSAISKQLDAANRYLADTEKALQNVVKDVERFTADIEKLTKERAAANDRLQKATPQEIGREMREIQKVTNALSTEIVNIHAILSKHIGDVKLTEEQLREIAAKVSTFETEISHCDKAAKESEKKLQEIKKELDANRKIEDQMNSALKSLTARRDEAYKLATDIEAQINKASDKLEAKQDFITTLKADLQGAEGRIAEAEDALSKVKLESTDKIPPIEELKHTISECEAGMQRLGDVNMKALETYEEQKVRGDQLKEELKHLNDERKRLVDLVEEINGKKKAGLLKVFEGINGRFKRVYNELSDGGEAELILENTESPFEGGLHIKARPPGKKVLRIEALSGGEKGLVSMAFIFAIQEFMPSPFYLLDEVDQNLDSVNAERVAKMVHRNSQSAQFLQVSLRHVTLNEAPMKIGVTMSQPGLSDIVMDVDISTIKERPQPKEAAAA
ncbi:MAG: chromosome segregation protein SMC [Euryarchaeota archaeon]|nr:chromosome segregation protein SMC [Euryarchaeota archaeon]